MGDSNPYLERGLWGILATPFDDDGQVDLASLQRLLALYEANGAAGVTALGVFGEADQLTLSERAAIAAEVGRSTLPYVVGFPETDRAELVEALAILDDLSRPPVAVMSLIASTDTAEIVATVRTIRERTGLPTVLQDYPLITGVTVDAQQIVDVIVQTNSVAAVKAEGVAPCRVISAVADQTGVPAFGGLGGVGLLDELVSGAAGVMTGFSYPEGLAATIAAWNGGGFEAARGAYATWLPLVNAEAQGPFALLVRKEILQRRGILASARVRRGGLIRPKFLDAVLDAHLEVLP